MVMSDVYKVELRHINDVYIVELRHRNDIDEWNQEMQMM